MVDAFVNPFDFKTIIIDYVLGTEQLFMFAFIIIYSYVAAKYNFSTGIYLILLAIGGLMFAFWIGSGWYFLIVVVIGIILFRILGRFISG